MDIAVLRDSPREKSQAACEPLQSPALDELLGGLPRSPSNMLEETTEEFLIM